MSRRSSKKAEAKAAAPEKEREEGRSFISRPVFVLLSLAAVAFLIYSMVSIIGIQAQIGGKIIGGTGANNTHGQL